MRDPYHDRKIYGRDVAPGDRICTETDEWVRVTRTGAGMIRGTVLLEWAGSWGHVGADDLVEVRRQAESPAPG